VRLGDASSGELASNIAGFGRALRRAGVRIDSARIALAQQAAQIVGVEVKADLAAAFEAVLVSREQDRGVFRELFDAYFSDPQATNMSLARLLPSVEGKVKHSEYRPRVREALSPQQAPARHAPQRLEEQLDFDAAMTASELEVLKHADFGTLGASEFRFVERLAREVMLPVPSVPSRRQRQGWCGQQLHWTGVMRHAARAGGEFLQLPRLQRRVEPLPLLVLVDVSGSMERYARLLLAFLHASTRAAYGRKSRRDVFAFGTQLTDLTSAFRLADTDQMLSVVGALIEDFGGGTRLGESLASLRCNHARRLVGGRTVVLLITDGLDTGEPEVLTGELAWLQLHSRRLLWLNPLLRFSGYVPAARGASALHRHAHGMLAVHNLTKLQDLAASLAAVMKT
jgi:uncharacterized protein with von Willebrand factor type A (vWA) domain